MVAVFVRLKLRLLTSGLRASGQRQAVFVLAALFGLLLGAAGFLTFFAVGRAGSDNAAILLFSIVTLGWAVLPIVAFGVDELLDPARLALLPLTSRRLVLGLLVSSFIGIPPVATLLALSGAVPGFGRTPLAAGWVAAAVAAELLLCVLLSRAVTTSLSSLLRSRRGRDATAMVLALVSGSFALVGPAATWLAPNVDSPAGDLAAAILRWSPLGAAGGAVGGAARGDYGVAAGQLALTACYVVLAAAWWSRGLQRALTSSATGGSRTTAGAGAELRPRWAALVVPPSAAGAVAAKDLRYFGRDPARRTAMISNVVPIGFVIVTAFSAGRDEPRAVLFTMAVATLLSMISLNQFGLDGPAYWMNVVAGHDPRRDLLGKNLAIAVVALPVTALCAVAVAAATGGWVYVPVAVAGGCAGCGAALGIGNVVSVRSPVAQPEDPLNAWHSGGGGQSFAATIRLFAAMLAVALVLAPLGVFIAVSAARWTPGLVVAVPLSVGYGYLLWRLGLRSATRWLWWRQPELLAAVRPSPAAAAPVPTPPWPSQAAG